VGVSTGTVILINIIAAHGVAGEPLITGRQRSLSFLICDADKSCGFQSTSEDFSSETLMLTLILQKSAAQL
jgi:hypothetical protein